MATWTHEQSTGAANDSPLAYVNPVKAGSLLIAMQESNSDPGQTTPTDTLDNDWSLINTLQVDQRITWWWATANGAGANTVTFDTAGAFEAVKVSEWSVDTGKLAMSVEGVIENDEIAPGTDVFASPSVAAPIDDSLVLGLLATNEGEVTTISAGTNFTMRNTTALTGSANDTFAYASRVLASAGPVQALFSSSGATTVALVAVAVFAPAGAALASWVRAL